MGIFSSLVFQMSFDDFDEKEEKTILFFCFNYSSLATFNVYAKLLDIM